MYGVVWTNTKCKVCCGVDMTVANVASMCGLLLHCTVRDLRCWREDVS